MTGEALIQHLKTLLAAKERRGVVLESGRWRGLALGYTPAADGEVQRLMLSRVGFYPDGDEETAVRWAMLMALHRLGRGVVDGPHLQSMVKLPQHPRRGCSLFTWRDVDRASYWHLSAVQQRHMLRCVEEAQSEADI